VWVFKGEILEHDPMASERRQIEAADQGASGQRRREPAAA
jgi:small subunit ribosomal protein S3